MKNEQMTPELSRHRRSYTARDRGRPSLPGRRRAAPGRKGAGASCPRSPAWAGFRRLGSEGLAPISPIGATAAAGRAPSAGGSRASGRSRAASANRRMHPWRRSTPMPVRPPEARRGGWWSARVSRAMQPRGIVPAGHVRRGGARTADRPTTTGCWPGDGRRAGVPSPAASGRSAPPVRMTRAGRTASAVSSGALPGALSGAALSPPRGRAKGTSGRTSARRGGGGARRPHRPARTRLTPP